jgi:hypothetical protein
VKEYYITFIDDCTRYCYTFFFISKSKALEMFKYYKKKVKNQLNKKIKVIQSDKGGE